MTFPEAADRFRELLKTSVAGQSLADVKVGSLLSGGFDSSTIVMLWSEVAAARGSQRPDTLSIAWDDPNMSERTNIEAIAAKAGSDSHILELSAPDVWTAVDDVVKAQGQPLLGQELIAQYHVYRLARQQGDIVVMDGNGLDELQAGLPTYEMEMVLERLLKLQVVDVAKELHCIARNYGRSYYNVLRSYLEAPLRRHLRKGRVLPSQPWLDERAGAASDPDWSNGHTLGLRLRSVAAQPHALSRDPAHQHPGGADVQRPQFHGAFGGSALPLSRPSDRGAVLFAALVLQSWLWAPQAPPVRDREAVSSRTA